MSNFNFFLNRQGVSGRKGDKGEKGFSPSISIKTDTPTEFIMTVQNEFDSFDTPNIIPQAIGEEVTRLGEVSEQHTEQISQLGTEVNALQDITDAHTSDLEELGDKVKNNQEAILSNQSTIHNLGQSVQNMESKVSDLERNQSNLVTINTAQTITGRKTFGVTDFNGTLNISAGVGYEGGTISGSSVIGELVIKAQRLKLTNGDGTGTVILQGNALTLDANTGLILQNGGWKKDSATGNLKPLLTTDSIKAGENINIRTDDMAGTVTISAVGGGGSVPDNVAVKDEDNTFTKDNTFEKGITTGSSTAVYIGANRGSATGVVQFNSAASNSTFGIEAAGTLTGTELQLGKGFESTKIISDKPVKVSNSANSESDIILTQGKLKQGANITITPDTETGEVIISSTGGGETQDLSNYVTLDTVQTITGAKTFSNYKDTTKVPMSIQNNKYASDDMSFIVLQGYNSYELGRITGYLGNTNLVHNLTISTGNYNDSELKLKTYKGTLTLKNNTLTFTKSTGEVIDLLAGGGSGSDAPENMVTTDTIQSISAAKTFNGGLSASSMSVTSSSGSIRAGLTGGIQFFDGVSTYGTEPKINTVSKGGGVYDLMLNAGKASYPDETGNMPKGNVIDQNNDIFLTQGNIEGDDTISIGRTDNGIQITSSLDDNNYAKLDSNNTFMMSQSFNSDISVDGQVSCHGLVSEDTISISGNLSQYNGEVTFSGSTSIDGILRLNSRVRVNGEDDSYIILSNSESTPDELGCIGVRCPSDNSMLQLLTTNNSSGGVSFRYSSEDGREYASINNGKAMFSYRDGAGTEYYRNTLYTDEYKARLVLGATSDTDFNESTDGVQITASKNGSNELKGVISAKDGVEIYSNNNISGNAIKVDSNGFTYGGAQVLTANTNMIDGQWRLNQVTLLNNAEISTTDKTISLASILPADNNKYEVLITAQGVSGATLDNYTLTKIRSDIITASVSICENRCYVSGKKAQAGGSVIIPVGSARYLVVSGDSNNSGIVTLILKAYRRIGFNT